MKKETEKTNVAMIMFTWLSKYSNQSSYCRFGCWGSLVLIVVENDGKATKVLNSKWERFIYMLL